MADSRQPDDTGTRHVSRRSSAPVRYSIATVTILLALLFRYALRDVFGSSVPYLQFYPAVLAAAWLGGLGPGLLATGLAGAGAMFFLLPPAGFAVGEIVDQLSLGIFLATGAVITWLNDRLHLARDHQTATAASASARAERLDAILNTTADGIIVIDTRGRIEAFNRAATELFGFPEAEVVGRNVSLLMPSPEHEQHDGYLRRFLETGEAKIIGLGREVTGRRRDGTQFPMQLSVAEMRIGGERKFTGVVHDLSKRAKLGESLRASEARWRAIVDSAVDGIVVIDAHGRIEAFNPAAERLFGYEQHELLGENVNVLMPSPYHEEHDTYLARYHATRKRKIIGIGREVQGRRKGGTTFPLHLSVGEIVIEGERKFTGILHDLSARVQMEEQIREQAALARLGEMAAVIAHEVKNPLAGIRGTIQVVSNRLSKDGTAMPILGEIVNRIDALDQMMKDLLLFARPPSPNLAPTDLVPLVTATANLLSQDPALRELTIEVKGSAPAVHVDPAMLKIVFQNLLINGSHAMQGKGKIHVAVSATESACEIAFSDSGPGIPSEIRQKIFVPFFTTKSRGSGLGLPTVKRLIDAHKGQISIDCPPAGGTHVTVRLPLRPS